MEYDQLELQVIIMMLVFDKKVVSLEDNVKKLNVFFMKKHRKRMIEEFNKYAKEMNLRRNKPCAWKVYTNKNEILYVYTENELQARTFAISMKYEPLKVAYVPEEELMTVNDVNITIGELTQGKRVPYLIGIYELGYYKMEGI